MAAPKGNKYGKNGGRPKMIQDPKELYAMFEQYKTWADTHPIKIEDYVGKNAKRVFREKPRAYTMEGFENFVANIDGMPQELEQYFSNREERYNDFVAICSRIRREIRQNQIEGGMAGVYNPSITQRLNGLVEKTESKVTVEQPLFDDADDTGTEEG